ncbi:hypothetical protein GCM10007147_41460 [Nocardiopsis kunsanensis]|uniref:Uncharacterized protein n=1 Tax=Nocardiopsis kunsanensis TaxID=141693 RepID=A0A919CLP0_9ACTN|nr:hypothetical protein [Nocardiopsis kunsanensis]GHD35204.1 hypothetical protein GCM10007147_41460 [Nocardiopsis kunsanensis]
MNARSDESTRPAVRPGDRPRHRSTGEHDSAKRVTFTVAAVATSLLLLVTAAGLGWFLLSSDGPASELTSGVEEAEDPTAGSEPSDDSPAPEGVLSDPGSGVAYELPDGGWERLGDDEVPQEYSSYVVLGSVDDPDAFIVTGSQRFDGTESLEETGLRLASDAVGTFVGEGEVPEVAPSGTEEVDGHPAFGASVGAPTGDGPYGRLVVVEMDASHGAFALGLNTDGGDEASADVDTALDSVGVL